MNSLIMFLLGACALITAVAAQRLIAPFYGLGPFLDSSTQAIALLALAAGLLLGSRLRSSDTVGRGIGIPMFVAAGWTLVIPWLRTPALRTLEPLGLRAATIASLALFVGVPLFLIGFAMARMTRSADRDGPGRERDSLASLVPALFGAAVSAPLVTWLLLPEVGVSRTLLLVGVLEGIAAWMGRGRANARGATIVAAALLAVGALSAGRFPATTHDAGRGVVEVRESPAVQYRVLDLEDGRYLLADGTLQTLASSETGEPQLRPTAVIHIVDLFVAPPESMLVLGLRGGAIAKGFARRGWRVRVIEPDPLAVRMASDHLSFNPDEIPVAIADMRRGSRRQPGHFPVVVVDAFANGPIPFHLVTREFFYELRERLTPDGILMLPIVSGGWDDPLIASLAATLRQSFRTVLALPTSEPPNTVGSIVLLASNRTIELPDERLPQPTEFLMNPEEHWAIVEMNHAWFNRYEPNASGAVVLTDDRSPLDHWTDRIQQRSRTELHQLFGSTGTGW